MEEEIEHLKDLKLELDNMSITGPTSEDRLNTHRKSLAISNILNELERLQKENEDWSKAYQEEKDEQFNMLTKKCLHCGKDTPLYCEKCHQELISKNAKLQLENEELKRLHINIQGMRNGKELLNKYITDSIPKQVIRDKVRELDIKINYIESQYTNGGQNCNSEYLGALYQKQVLEELLKGE